MIDSRCGLCCSNGHCEEIYGVNCEGCAKIDRPFWGECPVKTCCEGKKLAHCGLCPEFPCKQLNDFAYDKENGEGDGRRLEQCRCWAEESAVKESGEALC